MTDDLALEYRMIETRKQELCTLINSFLRSGELIKYAESQGLVISSDDITFLMNARNSIRSHLISFSKI